MNSRAFAIAVPIRVALAGLAVACLAVAGYCALVSPASAAPADAPAYVYGTADLPLMPGLRQLSRNAVVFDKPSGLVVEADAIGRGMAPAAVARFYRRTLPELGWREVRPLVFTRDGERLQLTIRGGRGRASVHFDLVPG